MTEEIRSYLLNSPEYSAYAYIPDGYTERRLNDIQSQFRAALLDAPNVSDKKVHVWRANTMVGAIYRDGQLASIANSLFDPRILESRETGSGSLNKDFSVASKDPNLMIVPDASNDSPSFSAGATLVLTKASESNTLDAQILEAGTTKTTKLQFSFSGNLSDFVKVQSLPIRIGFNGTSSGITSVPSNFQTTVVSFSFPGQFNVDDTVERVYQIPGIDRMIWGNEKANTHILPLYNSASRSYKRLLCLLLGYAISVKEL